MSSTFHDQLDFDQLWDYDQPAATEIRFRALLPQLVGEPGRQAELLTQIARAQGLQAQFDAAHATLATVEAQFASLPARAQIRYLLERGRVFRSSGDVLAARSLFLEAWTVAQAADEDFYAIDAAHMLAIIEPPAEQQRWHLLALDLVEKTTDERAKQWLGSLCNNIGWSYFEQGAYATALSYFQKALRAREEAGAAGPIRIARWCVAKTLRLLGRIEEAQEMQQALLAAYQAVDEQDGYVYEELGECYLALQKPAQAAPYFALAYKLLSQESWLVAQEGARLDRLQRLGQAAADQGSEYNSSQTSECG